MARFNILILSDKDSWIAPYVKQLADILQGDGHIVVVDDEFPKADVFDFCFILGYSRLVDKDNLKRSRHNLVVHESALPQGKGWSPLTWQILAGKSKVPVTLFEATERVDSGKIYSQRVISFEGHELINDLRKQQGQVTVELCLGFVRGYPDVLARAEEQRGEESFYHRRRPEDSRLDIDKTIREQFNLLRVVDNEKYPAFFDFSGKRYLLKIYEA